MSSLANDITLSSNQENVAGEVSNVLESYSSEWSEDEVTDYVQSVDMNQATTTAMSKSSIDDEILYHLKTKSEEPESNLKFNMISLEL